MIESGTEIIHLTHREGLSSVFPSQVIEPMRQIAASGYPTRLLVMTPLGEFLRSETRRAWQARLSRVRCEKNLELRRLPMPPSRMKDLWHGAALLRMAIGWRGRSSHRTILHCRGALATALALQVRGARTKERVIYDCRGLLGPEYLYMRGYRDRDDAPAAIRTESERLDRLERDVAVRADHVLCVSNALKSHLVGEWGVSSDAITVVPCVTNLPDDADYRETRRQQRARLGLQDRFVVAYVGSLEAWQVPERMIAVYKRIAAVVPNTLFLAITTHEQKMRRMLKESLPVGVAWQIHSVDASQVRELLAAADVGLLVRERHLVNQVASPVKFSEYLSAGVPVVITEGVGDFSASVEQNKIGVTLSPDDEAHSTDRLVELASSQEHRRVKLATTCRTYVQNNLSWQKYIPVLRDVYRAVA